MVVFIFILICVSASAAGGSGGFIEPHYCDPQQNHYVFGKAYIYDDSAGTNTYETRAYLEWKKDGILIGTKFAKDTSFPFQANAVTETCTHPAFGHSYIMNYNTIAEVAGPGPDWGASGVKYW
ncbi:hypothetical protein [Marinicrinis sediminis]|uniref:Uncharacterized protein n=1 Tax=Marinicrinis sediminis TaxID=1652465 RepID=A0ABW5RAX7_9BACL